jgi:hypothetical protein
MACRLLWLIWSAGCGGRPGSGFGVAAVGVARVALRIYTFGHQLIYGLGGFGCRNFIAEGVGPGAAGVAVLFVKRV